MRKKNELIWIMPTIFIIIFLFMIKFCTPKINKKYTIFKITRENIELFVDMKGTVVANNVTAIGLDLNLTVDEVYYKAGDFVKKGDIVVKFSDYEKNVLNEKRTLLAVKNRELSNLERQKEFGADVQQKIQKLRGEIAILEPEVKDEMKNLALVKRSIRSPFDSYIVKINVLKGGITNKNEPVLILAKKEDLKIVSESIPNGKAKNLNVGNVAKIIIFGRENKKNEEESKKVKDEKTLEELVKIENIENRKILQNKYKSEKNFNIFPEKQVIEAKLFKIKKIVNTSIFEFLPISFKELFLNEQVDIRVIYRKRENVPVVPKKAIIFKNRRSYIYLIDKNNTVKEKEIFIGLDNGEKVEIFGVDIKEGIEVIENPDEKIADNVIVERKKILDEEIENKKRMEKLEKENEKLGNKMDENEREIIRLKKNNY